MKENKEQYVSFKIAKLLKGIGFEGVGNAYYVVKDCTYYDNVSSCHDFKAGTFIESNEINEGFHPFYTISSNVIIAPTQQSAVKFMRDWFDLHIVVYPFRANENKKHWCCKVYKGFNEISCDIYTNETATSYEDGVEKALKFCIDYVRSNKDDLIVSNLSGRIAYGVKVNTIYGVKTLKGIYYDLYGNYKVFIGEHEEGVPLEGVKPYLKPMSSMTNEERSEFINYSCYEINSRKVHGEIEYYYTDYIGEISKIHPNYKSIDWLNRNHFDYRGLIEMGLALEAPEGMYGEVEE